jgi:hypothetical protein
MYEDINKVIPSILLIKYIYKRIYLLGVKSNMRIPV